jgi:hypothetical protein
MRFPAAFLLCACIASPALATEVSRNVIFTIRIPAVLRVKTVASPERLVVTAEDIARGQVEMQDATVVSVQNNCRGGVTVSAGVEKGNVERVEFRMAEGEVSGDSAHLMFWGTEPRVLRVGYRLYLKPGAAAGDFAWPVALRFANFN